MKMLTVPFRDHTACSVQSDLDLHYQQKASSLVISKERVKYDTTDSFTFFPANFAPPEWLSGEHVRLETCWL